MLQQKKIVLFFGPNSAFELTEGNLTVLNCNKQSDKDIVKFVSYSNKIKPEIDKIITN